MPNVAAASWRHGNDVTTTSWRQCHDATSRWRWRWRNNSFLSDDVTMTRLRHRWIRVARQWRHNWPSVPSTSRWRHDDWRHGIPPTSRWRRTSSSCCRIVSRPTTVSWRHGNVASVTWNNWWNIRPVTTTSWRPIIGADETRMLAMSAGHAQFASKKLNWRPGAGRRQPLSFGYKYSITVRLPCD